MARHLHSIKVGYPADVNAQRQRAFEAWRDHQRLEMILSFERPSLWTRLRDWTRS